MLYSQKDTLNFMCSLRNRLCQNYYARCALRPKWPELWAELSKKLCLNTPGRIHREPTLPVSALTARFDPRWTVVIDARVAACVLRICGIDIASTTGNNVGTSSSFKEILASG